MRNTATIQISLFTEDWVNGFMISEICQRHTLSRDQVVRLRVNLNLPARLDRAKRKRASEHEVPSREEIAFRAAEVRAKWTPEIEKKRRGRDLDDAYEIPQGVETPPDFDPRWYD